jgi:hypothetical protein
MKGSRGSPTITSGEHTNAPAAELDRARAFIATCRWTFAKSVPQWPHEYCLRAWVRPEPRADFDQFIALIARHGYRAWFLGQEWLYLNVDDWRYRESKTLDRTGQIINRARNDPASIATSATSMQ